MAFSTSLRLSALVFSLLLLGPSHCVLDPTSATLAIGQKTGTVCGIMAGSHNHSIHCTKLHQSDESVASVSIRPTISFDSISGGRNFICGLRSGDSSFFCWDGTHRRIKCVYSGPKVLTELSVGARHVAAIQGDRTKIKWWRFGCHSSHSHRRRHLCPHFPKSVSGKYHSLTSGDSFTCAINGTHNVHCWGQHGKLIQKRFAELSMSSVVGGGSHLCGLTLTGQIVCSGGRSIVPAGDAFEFTGVVTGSTHTCAIRRKDGIAVCWGRYGISFPMGNTRFEFLVAGGYLTCGLTTDAFNVVCWDSNRKNLAAVTLSLPKILPSACVPDESYCSCGIYPDSGDLCGGSGVICKRFDTSATESCQFPAIISPPPAPSLTTWERLGKWWFVFATSGTVLAVAGIGFLLYSTCLSLGCCEEEEFNPLSQEASSWHIPGSRSIGQGGRAAGYHDIQQYLTQPALVGRELALPRAGPSSSGLAYIQEFRFADLRAATNRFSKRARLGAGSFGVVYRGLLSDGREVAVKHCENRPNRQRDWAIVFESELATHARARHENVVRLIGYCVENNERLLVFEYMANKDLYGHLHPKNRHQRSPVLTSWRVRVQILFDVARGIEYLHEFPRIIHRDIKSSNILLDKNMVAKISDFGLALFGPPPGTDYVNVVGPSGTAGYVDPECNGDNLRVTQKSDVYSFGVVMFEMLTGEKAFEPRGNRFLAATAPPRFAEVRLEEMLDRRMPRPEEMLAMELVRKLAEDCVMGAGILRPPMSAVVSSLVNALRLLPPDNN